MNLARRVVVSVALAAALAVIAAAVSRVVIGPVEGGWFMYDPNGADVPFSSDSADRDTMWTAAIWLVAIGVWLAVAWRLFRARPDEPVR